MRRGRWWYGVGNAAFVVHSGLVLCFVNGRSVTVRVGGTVLRLSFITGVGAGAGVHGSVSMVRWITCVLHTFSRFKSSANVGRHDLLDKHGLALSCRRWWVGEGRLRENGFCANVWRWCRLGLWFALVLGDDVTVCVARVPRKPTLTLPLWTLNVLLTRVIALEFSPCAVAEKLLGLSGSLSVAVLTGNL